MPSRALLSIVVAIAACSSKERDPAPAPAPPVPPAPPAPVSSAPSTKPPARTEVAAAPVPAVAPAPPARIECGCPPIALDCTGSKVSGSSFHVDCTITNRGAEAACELRLRMDLATSSSPIEVARHNPGQRTPSPVRLEGAAAIAAGTTGISPRVEAWNGRCDASTASWSDFLEVER